jgi:N-acyl-phosphatidylethanolamine-hydrolysing phospholipase D
LKAIAKPDAGKIQVTWVGHSTVLLQMAGMNILTDPVFGDRASPVGFAGPARLSPPGLPMDALPAIDLVLVSHDHYDHLDKTTIRRLAGEPKYLVPLGLRTWFDGQGIASADELDWWQGAAVGPLEIWCVPARHFSGRNPFRQDRTLWCGWIIRGGGRTVYFAGDTGFSPHFMEIRRRFGPMDVSFLPIGAYRPRWFMEPMHLDPPQAVQAHAILGSGRSIPIHWGTFRQSREPMAEPPLYLRSSMVAAGLDPGCFSALDFGQTISIDL